MSGWWVADLWHRDAPLVFFWAFWVIFSIVLHELGHGVAAIMRGDRTPIETGHMTWNPLVHMGHMSLIVFAVIGIAWGAMPINPSRLRGRHDQALVAVAGPAVNLILVVLCVVGAAVSSRFPDQTGRLFEFFWFGSMLNIVLFAFNMLPIPPLDGSRILATYSWSYRRLLMHPNAQIWALGAFLLVFFFGARYLWGMAAEATNSLIGLLQ